MQVILCILFCIYLIISQKLFVVAKSKYSFWYSISIYRRHTVIYLYSVADQDLLWPAPDPDPEPAYHISQFILFVTWASLYICQNRHLTVDSYLVIQEILLTLHCKETHLTLLAKEYSYPVSE